MHHSKNESNLLNFYRKKASFKIEGFEELIDSKEVIQFKKEIYSKLKHDPLFQRTELFSESLDEVRRKAQLRARRIVDYGWVLDPRGSNTPGYFLALLSVLAQFDVSVTFKSSMSTHFFGACIRSLGSEEQQKYFHDACSEKIVGCFALTEVGHGTDARRMQTTATYDPQTQEFIIHTNDFLSAKCWIGNLGQASTHCIVFAQLITADGKNHGLHGFIAPIRDPKTFLSLPGVYIGDMGEKIGVNGMDNGFCMFNNYRIPRENLLNKFGHVSEDGEYFSPITDPRKRFAYSLGALIGGRVAVLNICQALLTNAITIAIRYSAVRKQFGPDDQELPIIEYPLQQWRLFPYLASIYAMKATVNIINFKYHYLAQSLNDANHVLTQEEMDLLAEMHALLSALKAVFSWTSQAGIQQCREACGGHGYLKVSGFAELRNNNDSNCTYEGDNNVLMQQASNWLLRGNPPPSPLSSLHHPHTHRLQAYNLQQLCHPPVILEALRWLVGFLVEKTLELRQQLLEEGKDRFTAQNHSQVYKARSLSIAYAEHFMLQSLWELSLKVDGDRKVVLTKLSALYGLSCLEKHLVYLHQGNYIDSEQSEMIQESIVWLCGELKTEVVALVDVIAPPDFILNSVLGNADGDVYKHLEKALKGSAEEMGPRPRWWHQLNHQLRSRL